MFLKKDQERLESFIGANTNFKGNVKTEGTIRIDGGLEGNIEAKCVIIGEKGLLKGDIIADSVIIGGKVEGTITAREILEVKEKAEIKGDISTPKLSVSEGAILNGKATMSKDSNIVELQTKSKV